MTTPSPDDQGPPDTPAWLVDLALCGVVLMWALNFVLLKGVLREVGPLPLAALRFACVGVLFEVLYRLRGKRQRTATADLPAFFASALVGYTIYQAAFILGLDQSSAFSTALMINTGPAWAALILTIWRIERVDARGWAGILLALFGLGLYVGPKLLAGTAAGWGDLTALLAALSWAAYGILIRPLLARYSAVHVTTRTFQLGAAMFLPFALPAVLEQSWHQISASSWLAIAFSLVFPITIAVTLWNWAIARRGVRRTVVYQYLVPVASGVLSWAILGETYDGWKLGGAAVILLGVALSRRQ